MGKRGFTLIELSIVIVSMAILAGSFAPSYIRGLRLEAGRKTALEIAQLTDAVRGYFVEEHAWPASIDDLRTKGFIDPAWEANNPFGEPYVLQVGGMNLDIVTNLPSEIAPAAAGFLPMAVVSGRQIRVGVLKALSGEVPTGVIVPWGANEIPAGWLTCDGRAVSRTDYAALFSVIGINYGHGDGVFTFNLPDLRGRVVLGLDDMGQGAAHVVTHPSGSLLGGMLGEEKHRLTVAEMPSHSHTYSQAFSGGRYDGHSSPLFNTNQSAQSGFAGADEPHNNLQPSMALYWIIKA